MDRMNKQGVMESRMQFIFCEERRPFIVPLLPAPQAGWRDPQGSPNKHQPKPGRAAGGRGIHTARVVGMGWEGRDRRALLLDGVARRAFLCLSTTLRSTMPGGAG